MTVETSPISQEEQEQILQTIEMFEVITQANPQDCQSLDILKDAYQRVGKHHGSAAASPASSPIPTWNSGSIPRRCSNTRASCRRTPDNAGGHRRARRSGGKAAQERAIEAARQRTREAAPAPERSSLGGGINLDFRAAISDGGTLMTTAATLRPDGSSDPRGWRSRRTISSTLAGRRQRAAGQVPHPAPAGDRGSRQLRARAGARRRTRTCAPNVARRLR